MTTFINARLSDDIESGARGGPGFKTTVLEAADGSEQRNIEWSKARGRWDISFGIKDKASLQEVITLFYACHGRAYGFRFWDYTDWKMDRQAIGTGNGSTNTYPIYKLYQIDVTSYYRRFLTRIVAGTARVWVNNVLQGSSDAFTLDIDTGDVVFNPGSVPAGGHVIEVECEFEVPVRFEQDQLNITAVVENDDDPDEGVEGITSIVLVELKE